jgi:hypothetical protein
VHVRAVRRLLAAATAAAALAGTASAQAVDGKAAFERLKTLAGTCSPARRTR